MKLNEASDVRWGRVEIEIIPFCVSMYDLLTCVYGSPNLFLEFVCGGLC